MVLKFILFSCFVKRDCVASRKFIPVIFDAVLAKVRSENGLEQIKGYWVLFARWYFGYWDWGAARDHFFQQNQHQNMSIFSILWGPIFKVQSLTCYFTDNHQPCFRTHGIKLIWCFYLSQWRPHDVSLYQWYIVTGFLKRRSFIPANTRENVSTSFPCLETIQVKMPCNTKVSERRGLSGGTWTQRQKINHGLGMLVGGGGGEIKYQPAVTIDHRWKIKISMSQNMIWNGIGDLNVWITWIAIIYWQLTLKSKKYLHLQSLGWKFLKVCCDCGVGLKTRSIFKIYWLIVALDPY